MIDLDALERVALAATPGPWSWEERRDYRGVSYWVRFRDGRSTQSPSQLGELKGDEMRLHTLGSPYTMNRKATAEYVATFSPETVLALIKAARGVPA